MIFWRWKTACLYFLFGGILFGASAFLFGAPEKSEILPNGAEEISQRVIAEENPKKVDKAHSIKNVPQTEAERVKSELALVGIKSEEVPLRSKPANNPAKNNNILDKKVQSAITISNFPSPVQGERIRNAGSYYSDSLQAYLFHAGVDYAQSEGAVIRVKHSGIIVYAGPDPILGQKVEVNCGEDWSVIYGGLENLRVKEGDRVELNQAIGQVGYYPSAEGVKDQPQLHYEIWHGDEVQIPK
jgi:murein DD-endopeptidase MepM/ murein hydrolase activator NlpD